MNKQPLNYLMGVIIVTGTLLVAFGLYLGQNPPQRTDPHRCQCEKFGPERPCCERCFCCEVDDG